MIKFDFVPAAWLFLGGIRCAGEVTSGKLRKEKKRGKKERLFFRLDLAASE
jgi:hypothetical protein